MCVGAYECVCMCVHMNVCMCVYMCMHMGVGVYVCICMDVCVYLCVYCVREQHVIYSVIPFHVSSRVSQSRRKMEGRSITSILKSRTRDAGSQSLQSHLRGSLALSAFDISCGQKCLPSSSVLR